MSGRDSSKDDGVPTEHSGEAMSQPPLVCFDADGTLIHGAEVATAIASLPDGATVPVLVARNVAGEDLARVIRDHGDHMAS